MFLQQHVERELVKRKIDDENCVRKRALDIHRGGESELGPQF